MNNNSEDNEVQIVSPSVTETPPAPVEQARPTSFKDKKYITKNIDNDWYILISENQETRPLTETEAKQIASMMNEQGSNIITLHCRNEKCRHKNSWIRRASDDIKKNVYYCDTCKQPMIR